MLGIAGLTVVSPSLAARSAERSLQEVPQAVTALEADDIGSAKFDWNSLGPRVWTGMQDGSCDVVGNPMPRYIRPVRGFRPAIQPVSDDDPALATYSNQSGADPIKVERARPAPEEYGEWGAKCFARQGYRQQLDDLSALRVQYLRGGFNYASFMLETQLARDAFNRLDAVECPGFDVPFTQIGNGGFAADATIELSVDAGYRFGRIDLLPAYEQLPDLPFSNGSGPNQNRNDDWSLDYPLTFGGDTRVSVPLRYLGLDRYDFSADYRNADGLLQGRLSTTPYAVEDAISGAFNEQLFRDYTYFNVVTQAGAFNYGTTSRGSFADEGVNSDPIAFDPFAGRRIYQNGRPLDMKIASNTLIGDEHFGTVYANRNDPMLDQFAEKVQLDFCRHKFLPLDPHYLRTGVHDGNSWGERVDDQWAIKRVGFDGTGSAGSAWDQVSAATPVVVAIVDSGLDWDHADLDHNNLWRNPGEVPDNGIDDDGNGYVDDIIGWDFVNLTNRPWDHEGHGTVVAGIVAAAHNDIGIAGINPHVRLMIVKAIDSGGRTRASILARSIVYAVDNGASIINLSVGGEHLSIMEAAAIEYAHQRGVLIVVAAGNEGKELQDYGLGNHEHVITVAATLYDDTPADFSNFGDAVDLAAPGVDVLSLRARMTDTNFGAQGVAYDVGDFVVGDRRYIIASGTSFAAPIVTGVASLIWSARPQLSAAEVRAVLFKSAEDIGSAGKDNRSGWGLVNAQRALRIDPDFEIVASIDKVNVIQDKQSISYELMGSATTDAFKRAWVMIGAGEEPQQYKRVGIKLKKPVENSVLMRLPATEFDTTGLWQIVLQVEHENGLVKRFRKPLRLR